MKLVSLTGSMEQDNNAETQGTLVYTRCSLIWNGYAYNREKTHGNNSWWRCKRYRPKMKPKVCHGRARIRNGVVEVTAEHCHEPEAEGVQNRIPGCPERGRDRADMLAAVKGFICVSDQQLLQSKRKSVIKRHQCNVCDMKFAISRVLETHKILEHQVPVQWICKECGMQFLHGIGFNLHMTRSHLMKPHWCDFDNCSASFDSKNELIMHKRQHQYELKNMYKVIVLEGEKEEKLKDMEDEKETKRKEKPVYKCPHCTAEYKQPCKLKYHMRMHTGEKPYKCNLCSRTFMTSSKRSMHTKIVHTKFRSHLCDWCGKKFADIGRLKGHVRSHTGEKPYSCRFCSRAFSAHNTLQVHIRQHTGEKPYVCDQCGQSFTVKVSLRTHLKSKHGIVADATSLYQPSAKVGDSNIPAVGQPKQNGGGKQPLSEQKAGHTQKPSVGHVVNNETEVENLVVSVLLDRSASTSNMPHSVTEPLSSYSALPVKKPELIILPKAEEIS